MRLLTAALAILCASTAMAKTPSFDPRAWRGVQAGKATEVLVLGTPHLSGLPKSFDPASLAPVLDRLAAFKPDIIAIENLSGPQCEFLIRYKADYPDVAEPYCASTEAAAKATGLDMPAATHAVRTTLEAWPDAPTPADRRRLAGLFLAAGDRPSAVVQWLRLPLAERRTGDGLDAALVEILDKAMIRRSESYLIASVLAARLGLERVHLTDDHTADGVVANLGEPYGKALEQVWGQATKAMLAYRAREAQVGNADEVLGLYRYVNAPANLRAAVEGDFGANLRAATPELYGRQYVAWWEVRNLRMVANIRASFGNRPGAKVLVIVGSSHKPYFDAYLDLMHDVKLVDAEAVLK